jgi:hypothetical protein
MTEKKQKGLEEPRLEKSDISGTSRTQGSEGSRDLGEFFSLISKIAGTVIVLSFINNKELCL